MLKVVKNFLVIGSILVLGACASTGDKTGGADVEDRGGMSVGVGDGARTSGADLPGTFQGMSINDPASPLSRRVIYFAFDSAQIDSEYQDVLAAHARYMAANPGVSATLEGHADERGTREYNIGLGERRAQSVMRLMQVQGAAQGQLQTVSFGEEKPTVSGHNETSWRLNRRVEIVYGG